MLDSFKKKIRGLFDDYTEEDYSSKLSDFSYIQHLFVYKNEKVLFGNYLWYLCWDKNDYISPVRFLEFLQFTSKEEIPFRVYTVLDRVHVLVSLNNMNMSNIYDTYVLYTTHHITKNNIFIDALLEDISLDIPQSCIYGSLNKAITFHRTTLDGELDDDFNEVKKSDSKFPIEVQPSRYIKAADSIYDIRDKISYISQALNVFVSDEELLDFGYIYLVFDNRVTIVSRLSEVWSELPFRLVDNDILKQDEVDSYMNDLATKCRENDIPLEIEDSHHPELIHPEESGEEVLEDKIVSYSNQQKDQ